MLLQYFHYWMARLQILSKLTTFLRSCRHRYSQYLTAQVVDSDRREIRRTKSSFYHYLCCLEWVPAYQPVEGGPWERKYHRPSSVYLKSPEVNSLLGSHACYVEISPSEFSRAIGKCVICAVCSFNCLLTCNCYTKYGVSICKNVQITRR